MKYLIASDVHGSAYYADKIVERAKAENADLIILLGDIYNHGPRNPLPKDYAPMKVAETLNAVKDKLIVVKGNCDSQVDTLISEFDFIESACVVSGGKKVFLTHGHVYNKTDKPKTVFDAVVYGHFHTCFAERQGKTLFLNCGSVSLPKNGTPNSYAVLCDGTITIKTTDGEVVSENVI